MFSSCTLEVSCFHISCILGICIAGVVSNKIVLPVLPVSHTWTPKHTDTNPVGKKLEGQNYPKENQQAATKSINTKQNNLSTAHIMFLLDF